MSQKSFQKKGKVVSKTSYFRMFTASKLRVLIQNVWRAYIPSKMGWRKTTNCIWGFPRIVVPQNGWVIMENGWFGGTNIKGNHHIEEWFELAVGDCAQSQQLWPKNCQKLVASFERLWYGCLLDLSSHPGRVANIKWFIDVYRDSCTKHVTTSLVVTVTGYGVDLSYVHSINCSIVHH